MFKANESSNDRRNRAILGIVVLIVSCFVLSGWIKIIASVIGIALIFTAIAGFSALYEVFNISTKKEDTKVKDDVK